MSLASGAEGEAVCEDPEAAPQSQQVGRAAWGAETKIKRLPEANPSLVDSLIWWLALVSIMFSL